MRLVACAVLSAVGPFAAGHLQGAELPAVADTWIHGAPSFTSQNYGSGEFLRVRARGPRTALIRFDPGSLPAGAESGATLSLHVSRVVVPGVVQVRPVLGAFSEDTVTFDTRPMIGPDVIGILNIAPTAAGQRVEVDVSALVASWIADPASNFGLAITADGSAADIHFGSRDAGTAPELALAIMNAVTVSHDGGDYNDPVTAANEALSGDTWCVNPTRDAPCTISIDEGIYILSETFAVPANVAVLGAGKTATLLVAAPGVEVAVTAGAAVEALSVINRQDLSIARAVGVRTYGAAALTRVAVRAEGAVDNVGLEFGDADFSILLDESDVTAAGGHNAVAIDMNTGFGNLEASASRISAIGAMLDNEGITKFFDNGGDVVLDQTAVVASGGTRAVGISISDEEGGDVTVTGGTVTVSSTQRASGITGGEFSQDLTLEDVRIVVDAPDALGFGWNGVNDVVVSVTGVLVDSSDVAVSLSMETTQPDTMFIAGSQLIGRRRALDITTREIVGLSVEIEGSLLRGEEWIGTAGGEDRVAVSNSILDGDVSLQGPVVLTCSDALGSDYQPLGSDCLPQ